MAAGDPGVDHRDDDGIRTGREIPSLRTLDPNWAVLLGPARVVRDRFHGKDQPIDLGIDHGVGRLQLVDDSQFLALTDSRARNIDFRDLRLIPSPELFELGIPSLDRKPGLESDEDLPRREL